MNCKSVFGINFRKFCVVLLLSILTVLSLFGKVLVSESNSIGTPVVGNSFVERGEIRDEGTVTLNALGGWFFNASDAKEIFKHIEAKVGELLLYNGIAPTRTNYDFSGFWYHSGDVPPTIDQEFEGTEYINSDLKGTIKWDKKFDGDQKIELYAKWTPKPVADVVYLDKNYEYAMGEDWIQIDAFYQEPMSSQDKYGKPLTAPYAFKGNFKFAGYWDAKKGGKLYYDDKMNPVADWGRPKNGWNESVQDWTYMLYARWTAYNMYVYFDLVDGYFEQDSVNSIQVVFGQQMPEISTVVPKKNGFVFDGYFSTASGDGIQYYDGSMKSVANWGESSFGSYTLFARWIPQSFKIFLDHVGGVWAYDVFYVTFGVDLGSYSHIDKPYKKDFLFYGYWDSVEGGKQYYDKDMNTNVVYDLMTDLTLYARWVGSIYKVELDVNGGTWTNGVKVPTLHANIGENLDLLFFKPLNKGHEFLGFFVDLGSIDEQPYIDGNMIPVRKWDIYEDTVLYARWKVNTYVIKLDLQGGESGTTSVEINFGDMFPQVEMPVKGDIRFLGFYERSNGKGKKYFDNVAGPLERYLVDEDSTLYAYWQVLYDGRGDDFDNGADDLDSLIVLGSIVVGVFVVLCLVAIVIKKKSSKNKSYGLHNKNSK